MTLEQYTRKKYKTIVEAAADYGISRQYLYAIFKGTAIPDRKTSLRIEDKTGGRIKAAKLMGV